MSLHRVNALEEYTPGAGVTCNSVFKVDTIAEKTASAGVTVGGVLLKTAKITATALIFATAQFVEAGGVLKARNLADTADMPLSASSLVLSDTLAVTGAVTLSSTLAVSGLSTLAKAKTASGTTSVPTATATTLFAAPEGVSIVRAYKADGSLYATSIVLRVFGFLQVIQAFATLTSELTLSLSGANVQALHSSGSTETIVWSYFTMSQS